MPTLKALRLRYGSSWVSVCDKCHGRSKNVWGNKRSVHAVYWWKELSRDGAGARGIRLSPL